MVLEAVSWSACVSRAPRIAVSRLTCRRRMRGAGPFPGSSTKIEDSRRRGGSSSQSSMEIEVLPWRPIDQSTTSACVAAIDLDLARLDNDLLTRPSSAATSLLRGELHAFTFPVTSFIPPICDRRVCSHRPGGHRASIRPRRSRLHAAERADHEGGGRCGGLSLIHI